MKQIFILRPIFVSSPERRQPTRHEHVQDDPNGPQVRREGRVAAPHHLRGHELKSAAHVDRERVVRAVGDVSRKTKVDDLETLSRPDAVRASSRSARWRRWGSGVRIPAGWIPVSGFAVTARKGCCQDDVLRLQVQVDDPLGVDEVDGPEDLPGEVPTFRLGQFVVGGRDVLEQLATAEVLGQDNWLLLALEVVHESNDEVLKILSVYLGVISRFFKLAAPLSIVLGNL